MESSVRRLVAGHLGVGPEELVADVSLRDDLAADSLDLVELAMALEAEFAIGVPEHILERVRTYGDLVRATGVLVGAARETGVGAAPGMWARLIRPAAASGVDPLRQPRLPHAAGRQRSAAVPQVAFTHRLLDQLTGTTTTVTVADYRGNDPWQADDLIAPVRAGAKRFGDGTPAEQAEALSGTGPCRFLDAGPSGPGRRATTVDHHVHVDQARGSTVDSVRDFVNKKATALDIGPDRAGNARSYQTDVCTEMRPDGELRTWREATCYSRGEDGRRFGIASSMTRLGPTGHPAGREQGLHASFDLSTPSANGFRPLTARLCGAGRGGICALLIEVSARVGGTERFAQITLRGVGSTMDVRFLPPAAAREAGLLGP